MQPQFEDCVHVWAPQYEKDNKLLENIHRWAMRMVKGLEGKLYRKKLRSSGFAQLKVKETSLWFSYSHKKGNSSVLWPVTGHKKKAGSLVRVGLQEIFLPRKYFLPRGWLSTGTCSPGKWTQHQVWQSSRNIWTTLSADGVSCIGPGVGYWWYWWSLPKQYIL